MTTRTLSTDKDESTLRRCCFSDTEGPGASEESEALVSPVGWPFASALGVDPVSVERGSNRLAWIPRKTSGLLGLSGFDVSMFVRMS